MSPEVTGAEDLDDYGTWESADDYGPVWVPAVAEGWAPYRDGHWGWIAPWGWTWIDDAPWGFAPFHYGRWVFFRGNWAWAPGPRRYAPVYAPALVGWVGSAHAAVGVGAPLVGWFPLGWNEVYVPAYRVSNDYVRSVNVTNTHATRAVINNYITNNPAIVDGGNGRHGVADGAAAGQRYANVAVPGAVTATSRTAFTTAQPVASHLARLPQEALARAPLGTGAPAIAPTTGSLGRPATTIPRAAPQLWTRPVVARTPPPPPPPSFEAQRHAVAANGGLPVAFRGFAAAPAAGGSAPQPSRARADVVQVSPSSTAPRVRGDRPVAPRTAPAYAAPAQQPAPRPVPEVRPRVQEYRAPAPAYAAPAQQPAPRAVPEVRPPVQEYRAPAREATPATAPLPRPVPEYRPPAQEYRAPAPAREAVPAPAPQPAPEYRAPEPRQETATREFHAPPPAAREAHPATPPAKPEKASKPERDKG